ncbi:hypothetical protein NPIL_494461 [Nephila pilipes]|uniref:Uncharacterized protein n=1 Tax=Nephila pilipes TaxID=299642 RepID=A0A8X6UBE6_NEPPI|nr:hypothetical protein NPIL_494461 [Nephila pilipes]
MSFRTVEGSKITITKNSRTIFPESRKRENLREKDYFRIPMDFLCRNIFPFRSFSIDRSGIFFEDRQETSADDRIEQCIVNYIPCYGCGKESGLRIVSENDRSCISLKSAFTSFRRRKYLENTGFCLM